MLHLFGSVRLSHSIERDMELLNSTKVKVTMYIFLNLRFYFYKQFALETAPLTKRAELSWDELRRDEKESILPVNLKFKSKCFGFTAAYLSCLLVGYHLPSLGFESDFEKFKWFAPKRIKAGSDFSDWLADLLSSLVCGLEIVRSADNSRLFGFNSIHQRKHHTKS